jgi:hypothetical protein
VFVTIHRLLSAMSPFFRLIAGIVALYAAVTVEKEPQPGGEFFQDIIVSVSKNGVTLPKLPFFDPSLYPAGRASVRPENEYVQKLPKRTEPSRPLIDEIPEAPVRRPPPARPAEVRSPFVQKAAPPSAVVEQPGRKLTASEKYGGRTDFKIDKEKGEIQIGNMRGRLPSRGEVKTATKERLVEMFQGMKAQKGGNVSDGQIENLAAMIIDKMPEEKFDITEENIVIGRPNLQSELASGRLPPQGAPRTEKKAELPFFSNPPPREPPARPSMPSPSVRAPSPPVPSARHVPPSPPGRSAPSVPVNSVPSGRKPAVNNAPAASVDRAPSAVPRQYASLPPPGRPAVRKQSPVQDPVMELNVLYGRVFYSHHSTIAELSAGRENTTGDTTGLANSQRSRIFFNLWLNPDGTVKKLFLEGGYSVFLVDVAYEYLPETSLFNKTLKHELTHVALYRITAEQYMRSLAAEIVARVRKMPPQSKLEYINAITPLIDEYALKMDNEAERRNNLIDGEENYNYQFHQLYQSKKYAEDSGKKREPCSESPGQCRLMEEKRRKIRQNNLERFKKYNAAYERAWDMLFERRNEEILADLQTRYQEVEVSKGPDGVRKYVLKGRLQK